MWADPEVTRYISGKPSTSTEVWLRLLRYIRALVGRSDSAPGSSGRRPRDASSARSGWPTTSASSTPRPSDLPELGYALAPWCYGQGFATEAVRAVLEWGDAYPATKRTWCLINPEARASLRVAEKTGYRELKRSTLNERPIVLLVRG